MLNQSIILSYIKNFIYYRHMSYKTPQPHDSTSQLQINRAESEGPSKALSPEDLFNNQN
jgi:hypothetical protein